MYQFQLSPPDQPHIPPTRLQVQEEHLRVKKILHGVEVLPTRDPVLQLMIDMMRMRVGRLLIAIGALLTGSRGADAHRPAFATRR